MLGIPWIPLEGHHSLSRTLSSNERGSSIDGRGKPGRWGVADPLGCGGVGLSQVVR